MVFVNATKTANYIHYAAHDCLPHVGPGAVNKWLSV